MGTNLDTPLVPNLNPTRTPDLSTLVEMTFISILNWVKSGIEVGCRHIHPTCLIPATMRLREEQVRMLGMLGMLPFFVEMHKKICRTENYFVILEEKAIFLYLKAVRGIEKKRGYG
ncbi:MAG: hypothetical protein IJV10_02260 [Prevotella sp.]|nr:hypothetical protein [Prevotella sp.]